MHCHRAAHPSVGVTHPPIVDCGCRRSARSSWAAQWRGTCRARGGRAFVRGPAVSAASSREGTGALQSRGSSPAKKVEGLLAMVRRHQQLPGLNIGSSSRSCTSPSATAALARVLSGSSRHASINSESVPRVVRGLTKLKFGLCGRKERSTCRRTGLANYDFESYCVCLACQLKFVSAHLVVLYAPTHWKMSFEFASHDKRCCKRIWLHRQTLPQSYVGIFNGSCAGSSSYCILQSMDNC